MKKSIIYIAMAILTAAHGTAATSVMHQPAAMSESGIDTLKNVKIADAFADNNLINPETVFIRKAGSTSEQLIIENSMITENVEEPANLQYPVITNAEVTADNQIIDANLPAAAPLDFSKINRIPAAKPVINKPGSFAASL